MFAHLWLRPGDVTALAKADWEPCCGAGVWPWCRSDPPNPRSALIQSTPHFVCFPAVRPRLQLPGAEAASDLSFPQVTQCTSAAGGAIMAVGGPVVAMEWCPVPSSTPPATTSSSVLAVVAMREYLETRSIADPGLHTR